MFVYDDGANALKLCDGTNWIPLGAGGPGSAIASGPAGYLQLTDGINLGHSSEAAGQQLFWDRTNHRLGIGLTSPRSNLHVAGGIQLGDDTASCPGASSIKIGTMRYNSGGLQICHSAGWSAAASDTLSSLSCASGEVPKWSGSGWSCATDNSGAGVPIGTIAAFAATSCPSGWTEYVAARGRFLRGIDNGAANDPDGTRAPGNVQADELRSHLHAMNADGRNVAKRAGADAGIDWYSARSNANDADHGGSQNTGTTGGSETRPKNVAVTFCQYSGTGGGGGSSTLAGLTDVDLSAIANGRVLTYNSASSKWEATTLSSGITAMTGDVTASGTGSVAATIANGAVSYAKLQNTSAASVLLGRGVGSGAGAVQELTLGSGLSLTGTTLSATSGGTVSGTTNYVAKFTGSTAVGNSQIFDDGTKVGIGTATPAASSLLDLTSANKGFLPPRMDGTARDAIASPATGLMIFNTTAAQYQFWNGTAWSGLGAGVPSGTIAAFAATSCPSGWTEYTAARGRFLRGIDNGAGNDPTGTRSPSDLQADAFQGHWHDFKRAAGSAHGAGSPFESWHGTGASSPSYTAGVVNSPISDSLNGTPRVSNETRPKNVAVLFCQYSGSGGGGGGSTTLAGLTDVDLSAVANGRVLTYNSTFSKWEAATPASGAIYSNACTNAAVSGYIYCCRMLKSDGSTTCKYTSVPSSGWTTISPNPFGSTATASYSVLMMAGFNGVSYQTVCRVTDSTGATICMQANSWTAPSAWTSFSSSPF